VSASLGANEAIDGVGGKTMPSPRMAPEGERAVKGFAVPSGFRGPGAERPSAETIQGRDTHAKLGPRHPLPATVLFCVSTN